MKLALDQYAYLDSFIHRWKQPPKLLSLFILIIAFSWVQHLILLPVMLLTTVSLFILSKLPLSFLLSRMRYPGLFIAAVVLFLPFFSGNTVIFTWGIVKIRQEGCLAVLLIVTRFISILTVSLLLFGTAPFITTIKAMRSLYLPSVIVDMMLLSYRYLEEFGETLKTMERAIKLRGFDSHKFTKRNLEVFARLTGSLFVRSYEQSQRVYQAMILRGYGNERLLIKENKPDLDKLSLIASGLTLLIAFGLIIAEIILSL
jgi:cobalt/nickel transport system permease protein